jgi:YD repeat-containing protein
MYPLTRSSFFALLLLLTTTLACKKDDENPAPAVNTDCQVTREEDSEGYVLFEHNSDGKITKAASYTKNNNALESTLLTDYTAGRVEKIRIYYNGKSSGTPDLTATATTDASGKIQTLSAPFLGGVSSTATFTYAGNNITKITRNDTQFRYEYDGNGNLTKIFYKIGSQAEELISEYTYDNKPNPNRTYVALLVFAVVFGDISDIVSPNNPISQKSYDGKTVTSTSAYVYTYNDKGFPLTVKQTISKPGKADDVTNFSLQYACK